MSLPSRFPARLCAFPFPSLPSGTPRLLASYSAGALFALGWALFLDAVVCSAMAAPPIDAPYDTVPVSVSGVDWFPGVQTTIGMLMVCCINKERLQEAFSGDIMAWRAKLVLFIGFAMMAGGLAGSVSVLVLKYVIPGYDSKFVAYGISEVLQSVLIMFSAGAVWLAQSTDSDGYAYHLQI